MTEQRSNAKPSISSMDKLMRVLDCFTYQQPELSAAEIGRLLDLPPATLYRQLQAMEDAHFIERNPSTHLYSLGLHMVEIAGVALSRFEARRLGQPHLDNLYQTLDMNANLSMLYECDTFHLLFSTRNVSNPAYHILGRRTPATQTAMGRMLLSYMPWKEVKKLIQKFGMRPLTPFSFQTAEELENHLPIYREQGYATDLRSNSMNTCCLAAPVLSRTGEPVAAISVSTTPDRFEAEFEQICMNVTKEAMDLSSKLGYYSVGGF